MQPWKPILVSMEDIAAMHVWKPIVVTIEDVSARALDDGDTGIVVKLTGIDGQLLLTRAMARNLNELFGAVVTEWIGKRVTMYPRNLYFDTAEE